MIRKIIEATFPSAASITFRISSGRAPECGHSVQRGQDLLRT
jgi:hypothetical protein